jgi:hypothetical protein
MMNLKGCGRKRSWLDLRFSARIVMEVLRKITINLSEVTCLRVEI